MKAQFNASRVSSSEVLRSTARASRLAASEGTDAYKHRRSALAVLRRIPAAGIVLVVAVLGGLSVYFRREIGELLGQLILGAAALAILYGVAKSLEFIFAWPIRKLREGLSQIKYALDWTPGWVYVLVLTVLGISDWLGVLPYGFRELGAWMQGSATNNAVPILPATSEDLSDRLAVCFVYFSTPPAATTSSPIIDIEADTLRVTP